MALPASFLEAEGMGRERGERGDSVPRTSGMGEGVEGGTRRAAVVAVPGARGELCSGREEEGRGLGKVEEGVGLLTVESIEL